VLEGPFGILPVEIKLGSLVKQRPLQTLRNFVQVHDLPFGLVINNGEQVELIADKIIQLLAGCV